MIRFVHPGSGFFFTHPGSRIQGSKKDTGSRIRNTGWAALALSLGKNVDAAAVQTCTSEPTRRSRWCAPSARCGSACGSASRNMSKFTGELHLPYVTVRLPGRPPFETSDSLAASFHVTKRKDYLIYGNSKFCGNNVVKTFF